MLQIFVDPQFDFIGKRRWAYLASVVFILIGLGSMAAKGGLRYGIDFSGGTLIQVRFERAVPVERIRTSLERIQMGESVIQEFGDPREFILRLPLAETSAEAVTRRVQEALGADAALGKAEIRRVEFVGPQVGRDLQIQALYAVLWSMAGILIYIAIRFDFKGGFASVAAIIHDVLVCLGAMSLTNREMSLPLLAGLLTIIGYSVNDTIVAYDRVRENRGKGLRRGQPFASQINAAIIRRIIVGYEHHQHYDGAGYPQQLAEKTGMDLFSAIIAIADNFIALTSDRPHRRAFLPDEALKIMVAQAGAKFHPQLLKVFVNMLGIFPLGTLVQLSSGDSGVVIFNNPDPALAFRPRVKMALDRQGQPMAPGIVDLADVDENGAYPVSVIRTLDHRLYRVDVDKFLA